jgi:magnesium and cobalt transporter
MSKTQKINFFQKIANKFKKRPSNTNDFISYIRSAQRVNIINRNSLDMIEGILSINEKQARDIMVPRSNMVIIDGNCKAQEAISIISQSGHSRFPLTLDQDTKISRILLAKDLLRTICEKENIQPIHQLSRPATIVPESKRLHILLKEFRKNRNHMAIVIDEYGNTSGLITLEDVLEEIVGDITDESDSTLPAQIIKKSPSKFIVKADTNLSDFNDYFHTNLTNDTVESIGGFLLNKFSYIPKKKESIKIGKLNFIISQSNAKGITVIKVETTAET